LQITVDARRAHRHEVDARLFRRGDGLLLRPVRLPVDVPPQAEVGRGRERGEEHQERRRRGSAGSAGWKSPGRV
jgi:hypothetical protein